MANCLNSFTSPTEIYELVYLSVCARACVSVSVCEGEMDLPNERQRQQGESSCGSI